MKILQEILSDIIDTHISFMDSKESGIWNVGTGKTMSFIDVAKQFNVPIEYIPMPDHMKDSYQEYTCANIVKLNNTLQKV